MAYLSKKASVVFINKEVDSGVAVDPSAGADAVGIMADGFEMNPEKETVERNILRTGIGKQLPLTGIRTCNASIAVEAAASKTSGGKPDYSLLIESVLGNYRELDAVTSTTGHSAHTINMAAGDNDYEVADIVVVKEAAGYHISPVVEVTDTSIKLAVEREEAFTDEVQIAKCVVYNQENSDMPSLTMTQYIDDKVKIQSAGLMASSMSLEGFETGQLPSFNFSLTGIDYTEELDSAPVTAVFNDAMPPLVLSACVYMDGEAIEVNNVSINVENTLGRITSTCSSNGIIQQIVTERAISGSFVTYMKDDNVDIFDKFDNNQSFSLFLHAQNPAADGAVKEGFAIYLPNCQITAAPKSDQDNLIIIDVSFEAEEDIRIMFH